MTAAGTLLAQVDSGLGGWWLGVGIGVAVVLVVAAVAVTLILLARRIARQADMAAAALDRAAANTQPLWELESTNETAHAVLRGAVLAREALEDTP